MAPKGYDVFSTFNPQQRQAFQQLLGQLMGGQTADIRQNPTFQGANSFLQNLYGGGQQGFETFAAPYKRQFNEQTVPALAERFAGMGAGAQSSSAFQQALGSAGAGLSENLASLRGNMQLQGLPQALNFSQQPFNNLLSLLNQNTQGFSPKQKPFWQSLLEALSPAGGAAFSLATGS